MSVGSSQWWSLLLMPQRAEVFVRCADPIEIRKLVGYDPFLYPLTVVRDPEYNSFVLPEDAERLKAYIVLSRLNP